LFGKILGIGGVAAAQLGISGLATVFLIQNRAALMARLHVEASNYALPHVTPGMGALLVVYFILGYIVYSSLFAAIGSMVSSEQDAQQVQMPVTLLLVVTALFIQPVSFSPESRLAEALSYIPFSSPIIMPLRLSLIPIPVWKLVASLLSLVAGCWLAVWIAARIYRTGLLMYGKRPSPRELVRWVRASR
jgi:ABC-2 type transport system permease protein